jgi:spore germination protein YaaH
VPARLTVRLGLGLGLVAATAALQLGPAVAVPTQPQHPRAAHSTRTSLAVTAFQEDGDRNALITRSAAALTTIGVDGVNVSADGAKVGTPKAVDRASLQVAHAKHLRGEILVGNWSNAIEDFSEPVAHNLLSDPAHIAAVAAALAHSMRKQGWDGVSVDLESLLPRDRAGLVRFLRAVRSDLPPGKTLSVCVSNETTSAAYRGDGYDLPGIRKAVSRVILMAYDEHGPWENTPGPVGSLHWQRAGLEAMLHSVPASKIDLGQAGYGYAWRPHSNDMLSDARARALVAADHATARWNAKAGEWTATLSDGSVLWWADARSYKVRAEIAGKDQLHGLAVWDLGLSDRIR